MSRSLSAGILPALVTPLRDDGTFDPALLHRLCGTLFDSGVDGLYVCGQTGEGLQQTPAQRKLVLESAIAATPADRQVVAHVGSASTAEAVELARHAAQVGAHAVSALPPAGPYSIEEVEAYYAAIAAVGLPLFLYFFPNFAAVPRTLEDLRRLCEIPGVAGLKFTSTDLYTLWELKKSGLIIFNGYDEILSAGLLMGADGGIGTFYNILPEWFVAIGRAARGGRWEEAKMYQDKVNAVIGVALRYPVLAAAKYMLSLQGLHCGWCAEPRRKLSEQEQRKLREELDSVEFPRRQR
jgi:N-acetylneuraminate lyase